MVKRSGRTRTKPRFSLAQPPLRQIVNPYAPIEVLREEDVELIHDGSMRILEQIGLQIVNDQARALMCEHGATVDKDTGYVRIHRDALMEKIATVPPEFTLHARNPAYNSTYGGNHINFTIVSSPPNASDLQGGRRTGNFEDYCNFLKLGQTFNAVATMSGYPVEPTDLPVHTRHLDAYLAFITLTEKPWHVYSLGNGKVEDGLEMVCIARGIDKAQLLTEPSISTVVNTNSPLKVDKQMLDGAMLMARHGQPVIVTPFTLAGAMSPITLAGALAQQKRRGAGGHRHYPDGQPRRAGDVRRLYFQRGYEIRRPGFRHAGIRPGGAGRRATGAPLPHPLPHLQRQRLKLRGRPGGLGIGNVVVERGDGPRQHDQTQRRVAGGRPVRVF